MGRRCLTDRSPLELPKPILSVLNRTDRRMFGILGRGVRVSTHGCIASAVEAEEKGNHETHIRSLAGGDRPRDHCLRSHGIRVGARWPGKHPPRRDDVHGRRPVHLQLRLLRPLQRVPGPGGSLLQHGRSHGHERLRQRFTADRHAGRDRRRQPARDAGLQLVVDDAVPGRDRPRCLRVQRPRAREVDPVDVAAVNPSVPGFGGPTGVGSAGRRRDRLLVRQLVAARRRQRSSAPSRGPWSRPRAAAGATPSTR